MSSEGLPEEDSWGKEMRGYFGVGVDGISKPMNLGNLVRIANAPAEIVTD